MRLDELLWALPLAWSNETRDGIYYPIKNGTVELLNEIARGQCIVSTLLIKRHLGGSMIRCKIGNNPGAYHYFNEIHDGIWVDSTRAQFLSRSPMKQIKRNPDPKLWESKDTWDRVDLLERRVEYCLSSTYVGQDPPWMKQMV